MLLTEFVNNIFKSLRQGTTIVFSNASFKDKFGPAHWIIENNTGNKRIIGLIDVPSHDNEHDSYISELTGLHIIV